MEASLPKDPVNLQLTLALRGLADRGLIADEQGPERFIAQAEQVSKALLQNPFGKRIYEALAMSAFGFPSPVGNSALDGISDSMASTSDPRELASRVSNFVASLGTPNQPPLPASTIYPEEVAKMIAAFAQSVAPSPGVQNRQS